MDNIHKGRVKGFLLEGEGIYRSSGNMQGRKGFGCCSPWVEAAARQKARRFPPHPPGDNGVAALRQKHERSFNGTV